MKVRFGDHSSLESIPKATEGLTPGKTYDVIHVHKGTRHTPHDIVEILNDTGRNMVLYKYRFEEVM